MAVVAVAAAGVVAATVAVQGLRPDPTADSSAARPSAVTATDGTLSSPAGTQDGTPEGATPGGTTSDVTARDGTPAPAVPPTPVTTPAAGTAVAAAVAPTALRVPAIGLDEPLVRLGIQPDGSIEVPADADDAGWLTSSAVPGRTGPAVLAGHVDSADGAAVFTRLSELGRGDAVEVDLDDGTTARFVVTGVERYDKDAFPTARVYGPAPAPVLRLVTCGGEFDRRAGAYEDNVVVYAVPAT